MILALLLGFIAGWGISMPIGPVNATAITRTIKYGAKHGFAVGAGAAIMDLIYCGGATQINNYLLGSPIINLCFQVVGFGLLVFLGIRSLQTKPTAPSANEAGKHAEDRVDKLHLKAGSILASFALGVVLYASNISSLPEWLFISAFLRGQGWLEEGFAASMVFAVGAGLGTAGWFYTLTRYFNKRKTTLKAKTLTIIDRVAGFAMLGFGIYFGYQIIFKTDWSKIHI
ncbi:MAG TPA: LysE family transporter [Candidatus Kapabacteria bacterium]